MNDDRRSRAVASALDFEPLDTPLLEAVRTGDVAAVAAALDHDARGLSVPSHIYSCDPLGLALAMGKFDVATLLLERGADPNNVDHRLITPLSWALGLPDEPRLEAVRLLMRFGLVIRAEELEDLQEVEPDDALRALIAAVPRARPEQEFDAGDDDRPPPPLPPPVPPPKAPAGPAPSTAGLVLWLMGWSLVAIAVLVAAVAVSEHLGWW
jgi:ankyrin repeat protein